MNELNANGPLTVSFDVYSSFSNFFGHPPGHLGPDCGQQVHRGRRQRQRHQERRTRSGPRRLRSRQQREQGRLHL